MVRSGNSKDDARTAEKNGGDVATSTLEIAAHKRAK